MRLRSSLFQPRHDSHLYSGELAAGEHTFTWSDPSVCNGMYECLVRMNGRVETLPVVLMR